MREASRSDQIRGRLSFDLRMQKPPESHADLLGKAMVASLATRGPSGEPHCTPVWFQWDGTRIRVSLTTGRQKYKNIQAYPLVAMSFVDPIDPYRSMEVRGIAGEIVEDVDLCFVNSLAQRYLGIDEYPFDSEGTCRGVVVVEPKHFTIWD